MTLNRNRNQSAVRPRLLQPERPPIEQPKTREIQLSAAEAEGCRALWEKWQAKKAELKEVEERLQGVATSVLQAHGVPAGLEVRIDFVKGLLVVPVTPEAPAPTEAASPVATCDPIDSETEEEVSSAIQE